MAQVCNTAHNQNQEDKLRLITAQSASLCIEDTQLGRKQTRVTRKFNQNKHPTQPDLNPPNDGKTTTINWRSLNQQHSMENKCS